MENAVFPIATILFAVFIGIYEITDHAPKNQVITPNNQVPQNLTIDGVLIRPSSVEIPGEHKCAVSEDVRKHGGGALPSPGANPISNPFSKRTKQKFEDALDAHIFNYEGKNEKTTHEKISKADKDKQKMLQEIGTATGERLARMLDYLSKSDLSRFEGVSELIKIESKLKGIFSWQGACDKSGPDIQGHVVKSFTEERKFIKQKVVPIKQDDPKACTEYQIYISEMSTPEQDPAFLTTASLSIGGMQSQDVELFVGKPGKPKGLTLREDE